MNQLQEDAHWGAMPVSAKAGADVRGKRAGGPESTGESHLCTPSTACPSPRTPRATCQVLERAASFNQDIYQEADIHPWWDVADSEFVALQCDDDEDRDILALGSFDAREVESLPASRPFASLGLPSWAYEQRSRSSTPSSRCHSPCSTRSSSPALSVFESPVSCSDAARRGRSSLAFCSLTRGDEQEKPAVSWADLAEEDELELQSVIPEAQPRPTARGKARWVDLAESASDEEMGWTF
eukprot:TRINITY_DN79273_c0_g1_i1.p1 TRINITY_DN79273_c0_g1~~TRINITY_DN79273_c0_g1_i1.p1  ORF type:complete len:240 (-),score=36.41 TRINITY_DN79273_c0_g1_i1:152-871(-)